ncbi:hypothetical protein GCM10011380_25230 [Sphingomonas metalli]|jgi:hypothetical protein|uniref:Phage shock protein B n=1 Tax=Sphingomonas metalli TaxID=1779358 RepID=A0A916T9B2_9SPHN|nr:hypothetical protein [Sphingomonas metalli]GGB34752.1 hypothetical protein GCM10011380_25230 [Sphingomonas metalli]
MGPFSMVVMIVLIVTIGKVLAPRYRMRGMQQDYHLQHAEAQRAQDEIRQLKERVAVLERVVTDNHGSIDLDREIERLRDR